MRIRSRYNLDWLHSSRLLLACRTGMVWAALLRGAAAEDSGATSHSNATVMIRIDRPRGRIMVPAQAGTNRLSLLLDTGYGISTLHPDWIVPLGLKRTGRITIVGIAGEEEAGLYEGLRLDFGGLTYSPRRVASLPSEGERSRRRRDGILGAGFFRRFVVEIDAKSGTLRLHEPGTFHYDGPGEAFALEFAKDTPIIEASVATPTGERVRGRFEIDTGCDDCLCLGREFVDQNKLAVDESDDRGGVKNGVGGGARIRAGKLAQLYLGRFTIEKPAANFFLDGSPVDPGLAGHIGMAALREYKVIFNYSRKQMILEARP